MHEDIKKLCGWAGPELAKNQWHRESVRACCQQYPRGEVRDYKRFAPWDSAIKIATGKKFLKHYAQQTGDCVSFGAMNALESLSCIQIAMGVTDKFAFIFTPYIYASSRLAPEAGNGQLGNAHGSLGAWAAIAMHKYGVLFFADSDQLDYSGATADEWGVRGSPWRHWIEKAKDNPVKSTARIRNAAEARDAICNGSMLTIASNRGYALDTIQRDGKSWFHGRDDWGHQMSVLAYAPAGDTGPHTEAVFIQNSWPEDIHGRQLDGPPCSGWTTLKDFDDTLHEPGAECFALSAFEGFPALEIDNHFFGPAPKMQTVTTQFSGN